MIATVLLSLPGINRNPLAVSTSKLHFFLIVLTDVAGFPQVHALLRATVGYSVMWASYVFAVYFMQLMTYSFIVMGNIPAFSSLLYLKFALRKG